MSETPTPENTIDMPFERVLCPRHGEPFRAQWPKGYPTATIKMLDLIMAQDAFHAECAALASGGKPDRVQIEKALSTRPMCCRLTKDQMLDVYKTCGVGKPGLCVVCKNLANGTPYRTGNGDGSFTEHRHICFYCVLHHFRPLS